MSDAYAPSRRGAVRDAPGPAADRLTGSLELTGREREREVIEALLASARRGWSGSLVVKGEAGMDQEALLGYATVRATGMRVLGGAPVERESDLLAFANCADWFGRLSIGLEQLPGTAARRAGDSSRVCSPARGMIAS